MQGRIGMLKQLFYGGPSIEVLHEEYAKKGRIDEDAYVKASCEVLIEAPVERVWELLSNTPGWGNWYPDIHNVDLDSPVEADTRFTWKNGNTRISSKFAVVETGRELTWTGVSSGAKAVHRHVLASTEDGATIVFFEESMAGPLLVLFFDSAKLRTGLEKWLTALKSAAEKY